MLRWLGGAAVLVVALIATGATHAENYRPGFACPRPDVSDQLTTAICTDSAMAQAELILEKVYYLHREVDGPSAFEALKARAAAIDKTTRELCNIPAPGKFGPMPAGASTCYAIQTKKHANEWAGSLYGPAYDEAFRDIDMHIALQRKLAADGLMPGAPADGVYGEATREAIITWQRSKNVTATGFLSNLQARQFLTSPPLTHVVLSAQEAAEKLQALFTIDMLNIRVPYLETMTGPAMRTVQLAGNREARSYRLAGCNVTAYVLAGYTYGYGLDVNRACKPDISDIARYSPETSWPSTFSAFSKYLGSYALRATCLEGCGNTEGPVVMLRYEGSHADGYVNIELIAPMSTSSYSTLTDAMRQKGDDYVPSGRLNCESR